MELRYNIEGYISLSFYKSSYLFTLLYHFSTQTDFNDFHFSLYTSKEIKKIKYIVDNFKIRTFLTLKSCQKQLYNWNIITGLSIRSVSH